MSKKHGPPRTRRGGQPKTPAADLAQLTIKVTPGFRLKLKAYIETAEETAGAYLERMARRDLDEKAQRIAAAWSASGPGLKLAEPDPAEDTAAA